MCVCIYIYEKEVCREIIENFFQKQNSTYWLICAKHLLNTVKNIERIAALMKFTTEQKGNS